MQNYTCNTKSNICIDSIISRYYVLKWNILIDCLTLKICSQPVSGLNSGT